MSCSIFWEERHPSAFPWVYMLYIYSYSVSWTSLSQQLESSPWRENIHLQMLPFSPSLKHIQCLKCSVSPPPFHRCVWGACQCSERVMKPCLPAGGWTPACLWEVVNEFLILFGLHMWTFLYLLNCLDLSSWVFSITFLIFYSIRLREEWVRGCVVLIPTTIMYSCWWLKNVFYK